MLEVWMGWTNYESLYDYADPDSLWMTGDSGRAYGAYQFDYRWGLVPFMQYCVNHSANYNAFRGYIAFGSGDERLVNNRGLINLFHTFADAYYDDFLYCQNQCFINDYLNPVVGKYQRLGGEWSNNAYMLGTLGSMAIRNGYDSPLVEQAIRASFGQTTVRKAMKQMYTVFNNYYRPQGDNRWWNNDPSLIEGGQYGRVLNDESTHRNVFDLDGESPHPGPALTENSLLKFINFYGLEEECYGWEV